VSPALRPSGVRRRLRPRPGHRSDARPVLDAAAIAERGGLIEVTTSDEMLSPPSAPTAVAVGGPLPATPVVQGRAAAEAIATLRERA
jgi:hypothetical protein